VAQYEQRPDPRRPLRLPPRRAVASLNTHDMPTFVAHWRGLDIQDRADLGLVPQPDQEHERRRRMNRALVIFLRRRGWVDGEDPDFAAVLRGCLGWLSAGPAEFVQVNLEDLWLETQPQNVPGTSTQRKNWRRKARLTIEQIRKSPEVRAILREIARLRGEE